MSISATKRAPEPGIVDIVARYHAALAAQDFEAIETLLTDTVVYISNGIGVREGREAVLSGIRTYFAEFGDHAAEDFEIEAISDRAVRSVWKVTATSARNGRKVERHGEKTAFLDRDGFIEKIIVRDRTPDTAA